MSIILECIRCVGRGERGRKPLSFDQAYQVMDQYLDGKIDDDQMAMLMMLIRVNNETAEEIAGFTKAFHRRLPTLEVDIDWPCYAGKKSKLDDDGHQQGLPWNLIAASILAKQGYKVLIHGHLDIGSERIHSQHYLTSLDINTAKDITDAQALLSQSNIVYLPLTHFAPIAEKMLDWKKRYGLRTPINTVVRGLNPGSAKYGIRGSFHPGFQELHAKIETNIGHSNCSVVSFKGVSGESEYNPKVSQTIWTSDSKGLQSHYWREMYNEEIMTPQQCPLGTPSRDKVQMANHVVASLTAVLFSQFKDKEEAKQQAVRFWQDYCAQH
ncbi:glycosyl transferase [Vibrio sp. UCD-FRSSP16_10]|uniref:glycosyl transferase family protein n=1 Tax=unclassified Vibrio TaxID=2614977 RepID=UPI00080134A1|nr:MULTISPECIES: glycosyl transferase family protein [unclassified Vibrio]OBT12913.1 glycosyl transferase [Vibrio sp. UCD-FRSSP16_30]OBT18376.1 glycosyl transferase [Vibrio sp. UCD-FRSSP16_10]